MNSWITNANGPWFNQNSFWDEVNRLLENDQLRWSKGSTFPKINVYKDGEGLIITAELPGVEPENMNVTVKDTTVSIAGEIPGRSRDEHETYHRCERSTGKFQRDLQLPYHVDSQKVSAQCSNGILQISLPRIEEDRPTKVTVKAL